jgi:hypothetical protein
MPVRLGTECARSLEAVSDLVGRVAGTRAATLSRCLSATSMFWGARLVGPAKVRRCKSVGPVEAARPP